MSQDSLSSIVQEAAGDIARSKGERMEFLVAVGVAAVLVTVFLVARGFRQRRNDRIAHEKVMRRLDEDVKRDGSEDA
jgi:hypothetical protein